MVKIIDAGVSGISPLSEQINDSGGGVGGGVGEWGRKGGNMGE